MSVGHSGGIPQHKAYVQHAAAGVVPKADSQGIVPSLHIPIGNLTAPPASRARLDDSLERQRNVPRAPCASVNTEEAQQRPMGWRNPPPSDGSGSLLNKVPGSSAPRSASPASSAKQPPPPIPGMSSKIPHGSSSSSEKTEKVVPRPLHLPALEEITEGTQHTPPTSGNKSVGDGVEVRTPTPTPPVCRLKVRIEAEYRVRRRPPAPLRRRVRGRIDPRPTSI